MIGPGEGGLDRDGSADEHRPEKNQCDDAEEHVENPLGDQIPIGDRLVENVEHRHLTDMRIAARAEAQIVGMGGKADVGRQDPEFLQEFKDAFFGR